MEDGKGARKSDEITATPIRKALPTSGNQQSEREQVLPKKPRSALKKDLTAYFGDGKRSPAPTTAGNPIATVIQRRELLTGTTTSKGDGGTGAGGKMGDNNSWHTPIAKKKKKKKKQSLRLHYNMLNDFATSAQSLCRQGMCCPKTPTRHQPHPTSTSADIASNKRYRKPD